jgi:hypothetical protein
MKPTPAAWAACVCAAIAALFLVWGGATVYAHRVVAAELATAFGAAGDRRPVQFRNATHRVGWLSSTGSVDVVWHSACAAPGQDGDIPLGILDYDVDHVIMPTALQRFHWRLQPGPRLADAIIALFQQLVPLDGDGTVGWGGAVRTAVRLPAVEYADGTNLLKVSPSIVRLSLARSSTAAAWQADDLVARLGGTAIHLENVAASSDVPDGQPALGGYAISVDRLSAPSGVVEGATLAVRAERSGDAIAWTFGPSARRAQLGGQEIRAMALELYAKDLQAAPIERLIALATDRCGSTPLSADEQQVVADAAWALVAHGFSVGLSKLAGQIDDGSLESDLHVDVAASPAGEVRRVRLERLVRSAGQLSIKGGAALTQNLGPMMALGVVERTADGASARYEYADGVLRVNGRPFDAAFVDRLLVSANETLNGVFVVRASTAPPVAPAPIPAPDAAVAPTPGPAESPLPRPSTPAQPSPEQPAPDAPVVTLPPAAPPLASLLPSPTKPPATKPDVPAKPPAKRNERAVASNAPPADAAASPAEPKRRAAEGAPRALSAHCLSLLQRASLGDPLSAAEQNDLRQCNER